LVLAIVGWPGHTHVGAIPQPSATVSVEIIETRTLEALQPKQAAEPAPAPEATAHVEGKSEASDTPVAKADLSPERKGVEPPPIDAPDTTKEIKRAAKQEESPQAEVLPAPIAGPPPADAIPEPPKAKTAEPEAPAKVAERKKDEKRADARVPKGGITSKAKAGKGTGKERATASSGSILDYAAHVRARVAANKPSGGGLGGTAVVAFGLTPSGGLAYARLVRSSGIPALDQLALAAVRGSAPFPPPPAGVTSAQLQFSIPFHFR